jgi:segregation and condensation protein B
MSETSEPGERCEGPVPDDALPAPDPHHVRLIEAALFASAEPVGAARLQSLLPEGADLAAVLRLLVEKYAGAGVVPVAVAGGWMFRTADDLAPVLAEQFAPPRKLSRAAVETLAVIAWHQPVTRGEIEALRGASLASEILDLLAGMGLVAPAGRRETAGRPVLWATTDAFLAHFGLSRIQDLPDWNQVKALGLGLNAGPVGGAEDAPGTVAPAAAIPD